MSVRFPDMVTAYTIFLTLPVSMASNECSFSKLKLLKTYLRAATSHDRLSDLGILSIERDRFSEVDKQKIPEMFAQRQAHRVRILVMTREKIKADIFQWDNVSIRYTYRPN